MIVGLIIRVSPGTLIQKSVSFNYQFFFNLLLPPIILASGYELHQANFFRNIGTILTFAFAGTFISALALGSILFLWTRIPLDGLNISFVEAFSVGATLSATDPVTILAIFNVYKVEPKLYTVIFGESILNDAIAIVLFETAQRYRPGSTNGSLTVLSLFEAIGIFLLVFFGSLLIGVIVGVATALGLKYTHVRREPKIESCLIVLIAYASYFFSNGVHMSGIVSLLFCGITLKHYAYYNMSRRTQLTTKFIFQILAQLSENFIFIYLGLDLFTEVNLQFKPLFIMVTVVGICIARYMSVFPLSKAINWFIRYRAKRRGKDVADELPFSYQAMLYWAGLRGAVGVALAAGLEGTNAPALRATVLVVVVLTVIIFGGTTARMLEILDIRTGVVEEVDSDDEFDIEVTNGGTYYKRSGTGMGHTPRRSGFTIPLDSVHVANGLDPGPVTGESYASSSTGHRSPQPGERPDYLVPRKNGGYSKRDRNARSRDGASSQMLLGRRDGSGSQNGSASGSSADEAAAHSRNRGTLRATAKAVAATDPDLEDFNLELDSVSDDDHLPPAAASHRASRAPSRLSIRTPRASSPVPGQQPSSSSAAAAVAGPPPGQTSRATFSGATSAFRNLLSGAGSRDHTEWFKQLDEEYIKPKLLLDQGSGHKGPGAV
ncbi:monovalent cation:H+ antiporter, CPA1 (nhx1) [Emydomyces testavorans]|uniref:Sodium/hydrogen exchanger n=1 Tax=Emydomyces testavorans TaxID=2070801 RepID=A0AAF0IJ85_9EURO|nr:monovalent cation:H+ antiporter, CPA1 (nhx1) [Emydomyces testavorans]